VAECSQKERELLDVWLSGGPGVEKRIGQLHSEILQDALDRGLETRAKRAFYALYKAQREFDRVWDLLGKAGFTGDTLVTPLYQRLKTEANTIIDVEESNGKAS